MKVEVEAAALDKLEGMVQKLQDERDELLEMARMCRAEFAKFPQSYAYELDLIPDLDVIIAKCTAKE